MHPSPARRPRHPWSPAATSPLHTLPPSRPGPLRGVSGGLVGVALAAASIASVPAALGGQEAGAEAPAAASRTQAREARGALPPEPGYAERIRELTTEDRFLSDLVDHLPDHPTVPSPLDHFGHIVGEEGILHYTEEIHGYLRALAEASPRVRYEVIGTSDEGRDMVAVAVADSATIAELDGYRDALARLSDPRALSEEEAEEVLDRAEPIYYATMGLHSPETGPPEMAMEIAYRLAVEESPFIRNIRDDVIFVFTPVVEADGRDRIVDWYYREKAWKAARGMADSVDVRGFPSPPYWGKYVVHDNNRDALQLSQTLSRVMMEAYLDWRPIVFHDLHQSVPLLYVSTGTGPYNEHVDPVVVGEWNQLAYHEVNGMTKRGMPGVWTHGFYTGWGSTYLIWMANLRNAIGRFYETFGGDADTEWQSIGSASEREWYRTNPAPDTVLWSLRNNTNYMQTGVLLALEYTADHADELLRNFWTKSKRQVARGRDEAPHAYVIPADQPRRTEAAKLVNLLREHGVEVHRLTAETTVRPPDDAEAGEEGEAAAGGPEAAARPPGEGAEAGERPGGAPAAARTFAAGDWVVRLDQPYHVVVRQILDVQRYPDDQPIPYDDTGWTLSLLRNVEAAEVDDPAILDAPVERLEADASTAGRFEGEEGAAWYAVPYTSQNELVSLRFALPDLRMEAAEETFEAGGREYGPGTVLARGGGDRGRRLREAARDHGLDLVGLTAEPDVRRHEMDPPRVAFVHTWVFTQNSGWARFALDRYGVPYDYISGQDLRRVSDLRDRYDVILFPVAAGGSGTIVHGLLPLEEPVAWKRTDEYRHIGVLDETDDMAGGMGLEGLANLKRFVEEGGTLVTIGSTAEAMLDYGLVRDVRLREPRDLRARGTVVRTGVHEDGAESPLAYGYAGAVRDSLPAYYSGGPIFEVAAPDGGGFFGGNIPPSMKRSKTVLAYGDAAGLLLSGGIRGGGELAGKAALVDAPLGEGHLILMGIRPFYRWETQGTMPLVFNALLHWNDLDAPWREAEPEEEGEGDPAGSG